MPTTTNRMIKRLLIGALVACTALSSFAASPARAAGTTYYISPAGSDGNNGVSPATPFKTIQKCANVAIAGDTCLIRAGVYRETVTIAGSGTTGNPITFRAYPGESVTISGADVVTPAWTPYSDHIYRTNLAWNLDVRNGTQVTGNQIFVDGLMMPEARWPNIPISHVTQLKNGDKARAASAAVATTSAATYYDAALGVFPGNYLRGAKINFGPGWSIIHTTCDVTGSTSNSVSFQCNPDPGAGNTRTEWDAVDTMLRPSAGNYYSVWGKLDLLDAPGEWFRAGDGTLYLWTPDGTPPGAHVVEAKKRLWAFDLSGKAYITLDGLKIFAATVKTNEQSHHLILQNLDMRYLWHFQEIPPLFNRSGIYGVEFRGDDNILRDSDLAASAGEMFLLSGKRNEASNNVVQEAGYLGNAAAVFGSTWAQSNPGGADKNQLRQNTIFNTGRYPVQADPGLDIKYNDLYNSHLQITDLGAVYGWGTDGKNAEIAYNLVHDNWAEANASLRYYGGFGIYLDDDTYNFKVYRNVVWNTTASGIFLYGTNGTEVGYPANTPSNRKVYNNTVDGNLGATAKSNLNGLPQTLSGSEFINNIAAVAQLSGPGLVAHHNYTGDAYYLDRARHHYLLRSYSPARDGGVNLGSPYMDDPMPPIDAPDIGALEYGRTPWIAGATLRPQDLNGLNVTCKAEANGTAATCAIDNLPVGRRVPTDFQIKIGNSAPAQDCINQMDYAIHRASAACEVSTLGAVSGEPILVRLGSSGWITTNSTIDLGPLAIGAISPDHGFTDGGTRVTITGRRFDTAPIGYVRPIALNNPAGAALYNYQVPLQIDTASLIAASKLRSDCADLRFSDAYANLDYWIEDGCNTASTRVWVKVTFIPTGTSSITLTYGNIGLPPGSNGKQTFAFFDDFDDGVIEPVWTAAAGSFYSVAEVNGQMIIAGRTNAAHQNDSGSFRLNTWMIDTPGSFAIDSEMSVIAGHANFKATPGTMLNLYGAPSGSPPGKNIGYWNGVWNLVGKSTIGTAVFASRKFSIGYTGAPAGRTIRWFENGDLANPRATFVDSSQANFGGFSYGPDAIASFDARFDNVRVRNFVYPGPTASAGAESPSGLRVTFAGVLCGAVTPIDAARLTCSVPPHAAAIVDVGITNPDAQSYTFTNGFTYIEPAARVRLPLIRR